MVCTGTMWGLDSSNCSSLNPTCSPSFLHVIGLQLKGRPCILHEGPQQCTPSVTTLLIRNVFQGTKLGKEPFISPAGLEKLSALTLLSSIDQRQSGELQTVASGLLSHLLFLSFCICSNYLCTGDCTQGCSFLVFPHQQ